MGEDLRNLVTLLAFVGIPPSVPEISSRLLGHLRTAVAATPYLLTVGETRFGRIDLTLALDLNSERWRAEYEQCALNRTFVVHARVNVPARALTTTTHLSSLKYRPDPLYGHPVLAAAHSTLLDPEIGKAGRITEFGDDPGRLHSFTAAEAVGWLLRESDRTGFPST